MFVYLSRYSNINCQYLVLSQNTANRRSIDAGQLGGVRIRQGKRRTSLAILKEANWSFQEVEMM